MHKLKKRNRIRRDDYCRVLVTETTPYETPIIFSNDGLYNRIFDIEQAGSLQRQLLESLIFGDGKSKPTIPYNYKIRKNATEFRRLSLIHPRSQWKMKEFYQKYEDLILFHCQESPASIRAPQKVAGSFFFKNSSEKLNQYKKEGISLVKLDDMTKHSPSFFSYRGHDRLYKFFESRDYFDLEKSYSCMLTLDVSKCFDSIYTHSISWAAKDKDFTKKNKENKATFAQGFDTLMQYANHGETNGILIGPEISRVFAEIIFQEVDRRVILKIEEKEKFKFGKEYTFRRYVDDIFIFSESEQASRCIYAHYADALLAFNLHTNSAKSNFTTRPFVTKKSLLINSANSEANNFIDKFLDSDPSGECLTPKEIKSTWSLSRNFIKFVKDLCASNDASYDEISGYLISVFNERVKRIVSIVEVGREKGNEKKYQDAMSVILDILFFLYQVSPSVSASYKIGTSVILILRFFRKHFPSVQTSVSQAVFGLTEELLNACWVSNFSSIDGFIPLEVLNILLASRELGDHYLLSPERVNSLFLEKKQDSYFNIISCLFYIRDNPIYTKAHVTILEAADRMLNDLSDIHICSEKAHLLLDLLSSPFVSDKRKNGWTRSACKALGVKQPSKVEMSTFLKDASSLCTHVNWEEVDLLNSLEKKELKRAY